MKSPLVPDRQGAPAGRAEARARSAANADEEMPGFLAKLADMWEGRVLVLASVILCLALGGFYVWWSVPVFQVEAMLQIRPKKEKPNDAAFAKMETLFADPAEAEAEVEIIKSSLVLGRTVEALGLDLVAEPVLMPLVGEALARRNPKAPRAEVDLFEISDPMRGRIFHLTVLAGGTFRWEDPGGAALAEGRPNETLTGVCDGETLKLRLKRLSAEPGKRFELYRRPVGDVIDELRQDLDVSEKKKLTNVLGLVYRGRGAARCAAILNEIVDQYVRHNLEKRKAEMAKALGILQEKMPELKARLDAAESRLHQFRSRSGAVDLSREASLVLEQRTSLDSQLTALKQKREELLRTYKENADVVGTVDQQIEKVQQEMYKVDSKVRILPGTQQEYVRLTREVAVETELYTALLNNIQQMQVASAGEIGTVTVVDRAMKPFDPIAPKKGVLMILSLAVGLMAGIGLVSLRRMLLGVEDHRVIESKLGLPVLVTIPHSKAQEELDAAVRSGVDGFHLLAASNASDLAVESLRSLRTTLNYCIKDARNPVVMVSGPSPMVGKSFISANFATVLAQAGARVLLVDGDLRKGNLHKYFAIRNRLNGLSDVVSGQMDWKAVLQKTEVGGLDFISSGLLPPNPSELLMNPRFSAFVDQASECYDYILIDAPPTLPVTDATIIAAKAGTVLLVAKFGKHPLDEIRATQRRFESNGIRLLGCIFNDVKIAAFGSKYRYGNYLYHYGYKK